MDMIVRQGAKCSLSLLSKNSKFSLKLPLFISRCPQVTAYHHIPYLEMYRRSSTHDNGMCLYGYQNSKFLESRILLQKVDTIQFSNLSKSNYSTKTGSSNEDCIPPVEKPSVFQKMKQMTKDYWHILIPVHIITSLGWVSMFYVAAKNGVDIVGILEFLNLSERYLEALRGSNAGHWAVTYALYKLFTPVRYTVTVGGTTMCIRYLNKWGILKFKGGQKLMGSMKARRISNVPNKDDQSQSSKT